jgi:effector-binding domain-containing protein
MEADPHAIVMCPYIVSVYAMPGDKTVYIAYRKPPASSNPALQKALNEVETLLTEIIQDAM